MGSYTTIPCRMNDLVRIRGPYSKYDPDVFKIWWYFLKVIWEIYILKKHNDKIGVQTYTTCSVKVYVHDFEHFLKSKVNILLSTDLIFTCHSDIY